jgi:hypothetical protein
MIFSADETTDVGTDGATPVSDDYGSKDNEFTGQVEWVQIDIDEAAENNDHLITAEPMPPRAGGSRVRKRPSSSECSSSAIPTGRFSSMSSGRSASVIPSCRTSSPSAVTPSAMPSPTPWSGSPTSSALSFVSQRRRSRPQSPLR